MIAIIIENSRGLTLTVNSEAGRRHKSGDNSRKDEDKEVLHDGEYSHSLGCKTVAYQQRRNDRQKYEHNEKHAEKHTYGTQRLIDHRQPPAAAL